MLTSPHKTEATTTIRAAATTGNANRLLCDVFYWEEVYKTSFYRGSHNSTFSQCIKALGFRLLIVPLFETLRCKLRPNWHCYKGEQLLLDNPARSKAIQRY